MSNPWETGSEMNGHRLAWCDAQSRIDAIKGMTTERLITALDYPDTQKVVAAKIRSELKKRGHKCN